MKEASPVKFYLAKYFFLALALLQGLVALLLFLNRGDSPKTHFSVFVLITLSLIFMSLFFLASSKIKRVAISKKRLAVKDRQKIKRYDWDDVKMMKFIPFLNMYCVKLKGKKSNVYFLSSKKDEALFGLFSSSQNMGHPKR